MRMQVVPDSQEPTEAPLVAILHISRACKPFRRRDIETLMATMTRRNHADALTGFLVQAGDNFLQYIEGSRTKVAACYRRIETDRRHTDLTLIAYAELAGRRFGSWDMGYFMGDADGTERLEPVMMGWRGAQSELIEEAVRINAAAYRPDAADRMGFEIAPCPVLLRRLFG